MVETAAVPREKSMHDPPKFLHGVSVKNAGFDIITSNLGIDLEGAGLG